MKKRSKSSHGSAKRRAAVKPAKAKASNMSRRDLLRYVRNGTIAVGVLGLGGITISQTHAKNAERSDLSVIGNGIPTVLQIHDPQCPTCRTLQRRTLQAAKSFEPDELQVRIANINRSEGSEIARRYGVGHVTLLLFDGEGHMQHVVRGLQEVSQLRDQFRAHVMRFSGNA